ncbi:hypothetical protein Tco_0734236 [Tanacetum coccineum]
MKIHHHVWWCGSLQSGLVRGDEFLQSGLARGGSSESGASLTIGISDHGIGKSSLIAAAALENFPESVSPVLPATHSSRLLLSGGRKAKLEEELTRADAICVNLCL